MAEPDAAETLRAAIAADQRADDATTWTDDLPLATPLDPDFTCAILVAAPAPSPS